MIVDLTCCLEMCVDGGGSDKLHAELLEVFGDEEIVLLGHSLGGFLACSYALEKPEHLKRVILAAPVGIAPWKFSNEGGYQRKIVRFLIWTVGITPQFLLRVTGYFSKSLWQKVGVASNYRDLDEDGWEYLYQAQMGAPSGDRAFMNLLTQDGWGNYSGLILRKSNLNYPGYPLLDKLKEMKVPGRIIYGARDYVRPDIMPEVSQRTSLLDHRVISDAGHHMYWSHNLQFSDTIINFHPVPRKE